MELVEHFVTNSAGRPISNAKITVVDAKGSTIKRNDASRIRLTDANGRALVPIDPGEHIKVQALQQGYSPELLPGNTPGKIVLGDVTNLRTNHMFFTNRYADLAATATVGAVITLSVTTLLKKIFNV